jgi:excisionase family DNA binding protein
MPILNGYMNIMEAANILGIHPGTLKRLCRERKLAAEKIHNGWLIHSEVVHSFAKGYNGRRGRPRNDTFQQPNLRV